MSQLQNGFDAAKQITYTVLLFYRWFRSQPTAIPTPAGTQAGTGKRWVTVPATGRRHGRRHGRATKPIAEGWQLSSQMISYDAADFVTHTTTFPELTLRELRPVRVPAPHGISITAGVASLRLAPM